MWSWFKNKRKAGEAGHVLGKFSLFRRKPRTCDNCKDYPVRINRSVSGYRKLIHNRVDEAKKISDKEIMKIGDCVNNIVSHTRQYIDESGQVLGSNFSEQSKSLDKFIAHAQQTNAAQSDTIERALLLSDEISRTGTAVDKLARDANLLAINAAIEASRLGSDGNAFGVISKAMKRMSREIVMANNLISDSTHAIKECLPAIISQGESQIERLEEFTHTMQKFMVVAEQLMSTSSNAGNTHLDMILDLAYSALSHLQFQDPMIQSLQKIDILMHDLQRDLSHKLNYTPAINEIPIGSNNLGELYEDSNQTSGPQRHSGDVLLF